MCVGIPCRRCRYFAALPPVLGAAELAANRAGADDAGSGDPADGEVWCEGKRHTFAGQEQAGLTVLL